jgi:hypothetical protein
MSRDLDNLNSVFHELQTRYGDDDPIVLEVKREIESRELTEAKHSRWLVTYREQASKARGWTPVNAGAGGIPRASSSQART